MRVPGDFLPLRILAAMPDRLNARWCRNRLRSVDPFPRTCLIGLTLSTVCGQAICGLQLGHIDFNHLVIRRVGIGSENVEVFVDAGLFLQVAPRLVIGGTIPDVAPASTDILQITRRPEVDICSIAGPWNSMTLKFAPSAVSLPIRCRIRSLGAT